MSKGEQAVEAILNAAEDLFLQQGFNGTSMRHIAKAVGYRSVAGLYNHFSDKEQLFVALLDDRSPYDHIFAEVASLEAPTAEAFIPLVYQTMLRQLQASMKFLRLVMIDFLEFGGDHVRELVGEAQAELAQILMRMMQFDDLKESVSPIALGRMMGMLLFGYAITREILPAQILDTMTEEEWQKHITQAVLYGVIDKDGKE